MDFTLQIWFTFGVLEERSDFDEDKPGMATAPFQTENRVAEFYLPYARDTTGLPDLIIWCKSS